MSCFINFLCLYLEHFIISLFKGCKVCHFQHIVNTDILKIKWLHCFFKMARLRYNSYIIQFTHWKNITQWLLIYSQSCANMNTINFRTFLLLQKETTHSLAVNPQTSYHLPTQPLATINLPSVSTDLPILDIWYKWNHKICSPLKLAFSLNIMLSKFIHVLASISTSFLFIN